MKVKKSTSYKVGVGGIRAILQDKIKSIAFEEGEAVEVTKEQLETLSKLGWIEEVKNDGNSENIKQVAENRDTSAIEGN